MAIKLYTSSIRTNKTNNKLAKITVMWLFVFLFSIFLNVAGKNPMSGNLLSNQTISFSLSSFFFNITLSIITRILTVRFDLLLFKNSHLVAFFLSITVILLKSRHINRRYVNAKFIHFFFSISSLCSEKKNMCVCTVNGAKSIPYKWLYGLKLLLFYLTRTSLYDITNVMMIHMHSDSFQFFNSSWVLKLHKGHIDTKEVWKDFYLHFGSCLIMLHSEVMLSVERMWFFNEPFTML